MISVSRKKILCNEEVYANFDSAKNPSPIIEFKTLHWNLEDVKNKVEGLEQIQKFKKMFAIPDHILSIKMLDDYKRNQEFNEATSTNPPRMFLESISPHQLDQGENSSEILTVGNLDLVMEEIQKVKERLRFSDGEDGKAEGIRKAPEKLESAIQNEAPRKGGLKRKASPGSFNVNPENILDSERQRNIEWRLTDFDEEEKESPGKRTMKRKIKGANSGKLKKGDRASIPTKTFGDEYAKGKDKTSY